MTVELSLKLNNAEKQRYLHALMMLYLRSNIVSNVPSYS